jgi:hypothetical protein
MHEQITQMQQVVGAAEYWEAAVASMTAGVPPVQEAADRLRASVDGYRAWQQRGGGPQ